MNASLLKHFQRNSNENVSRNNQLVSNRAMPPTPRQTVPRPGGRGGIVSLLWQPIFQTAINQLRSRKFTRDPDPSLPSFVKIRRIPYSWNEERLLKRRCERGIFAIRGIRVSTVSANSWPAVKPTDLLLLNTPSNPQWPSFVVGERERKRDFTLIRGRACSKAIRACYSFIHSMFE